jgi:hypothetical protein
MSLYIPKEGIALGLSRAIQRGMLQAASPQGLAPELLNGKRKQLIIHWCGTTNLLEFDESWDPGRGDGRIELDHYMGSGGRGLPLPPNVDIERLNIRMGVPLWVVSRRDGKPLPLAYGLFHPLFTSAQLDFYNPDNGRYLSRMYFIDPRQDGGHASRNTVNRLMVEQSDELVLRGADLVIDARPMAPKLR